MRKLSFTEEQIVGMLQGYATGAKVSDLYRKHGMSDAALYTWKSTYRFQRCEPQKLTWNKANHLLWSHSGLKTLPDNR